MADLGGSAGRAHANRRAAVQRGKNFLGTAGCRYDQCEQENQSQHVSPLTRNRPKKFQSSFETPAYFGHHGPQCASLERRIGGDGFARDRVGKIQEIGVTGEIGEAQTDEPRLPCPDQLPVSPLRQVQFGDLEAVGGLGKPLEPRRPAILSR